MPRCIEGTARSFSARMLLDRTDGLPGRLRYRLIGMWSFLDHGTHERESLYPPVWGLSSLRPGIIRFQVNIENLGEGCLRPWPAKYSLQGDRTSAMTS